MQLDRRLFNRLVLALPVPLGAGEKPAPLVFACSAENDLYRALSHAGFPRYGTAEEAIDRAPGGAGVLLLAEGYPDAAVRVDDRLWARARRKHLRVYIEFPAALPGLAVGTPRTAHWERAVVASEAFGASLERMRILSVHDCSFVPLRADKPDLALARVAGFDTAVYGLPPKDVFPLLFEHPRGDILVAATKLSQFIAARYAPSDAWGPIWGRILAWLAGGGERPALRWTPSVRPSYARGEALPAGSEASAFRRGVAWFENARMLIDRSWAPKVMEAAKYPDRVAPRPDPALPCGDGTEGVLEGFNAGIRSDGTQPVRWWIRADCTSETAMSMAFSAKLDGAAGRAATAANLQDVVYFRSEAPWTSADDPSYGLISWQLVMPYFQHDIRAFYGDDNARAMLGTMATAALLRADRWDEVLMRALLANFRTTGKLGFRRNRLDLAPLRKIGWRTHYESDVISYSPHYQAYLWACLLWAYRHTGYEPFLTRTRDAIRMTMEAYPDKWHWTNGLQQERARMLLPLAWLIRVEDAPQHREWLRRIASDLVAAQDACGAIAEELGSAGRGQYAPPKSNEEYGTNEAPLIQRNGDPLSDLLYTTNFAFLGLHEAARSTGDTALRDAEDRLAAFLTRIQVRSQARPELDGAWFRAFEFRRWEYWASNADAGWGAWSVETGWTQAWITSVLALRAMKTSLWDLTANSRAGDHFNRVRREMLPD